MTGNPGAPDERERKRGCAAIQMPGRSIHHRGTEDTEVQTTNPLSFSVPPCLCGSMAWLCRKALTRIFHSHEDFFQRNIRPPSGRSDFVAVSPDEVGPTGRRFHTSECEIFGLRPTCWSWFLESQTPRDRPATKGDFDRVLWSAASGDPTVLRSRRATACGGPELNATSGTKIVAKMHDSNRD